MSNVTFQDSLAAFLASATSDRFRRLQDQVMTDPDYDPLGVQSSELPMLCEASHFGELILRAHESRTAWQICPRFHFLVGIAAFEVGDIELCETSRATMQACLRGLLSTGDGSRRRPFRVTFLSDEYDLIRVFDGDVRCQQLVSIGDRQHDVITCHDGNEVWFDVTRLLACLRPGRQTESAWPILSTGI